MAMFTFIGRLNLEFAMRYYLSVLLLIDGMDKFFNLVTYWPLFLAPQIPELLGVSPATILAVVGVLEMLVGVVMWFNQRWGGLLVALLLLGIAINLLIGGLFLNIVLIDIALAMAALALTQAAVANQQTATNHTNGTTYPVE